MLCISGFADEVMFSRDSSQGRRHVDIDEARPLQRHVQANASAASCWLRPVSDDGGRKD